MKLPTNAIIAVTLNCNSHCQMCNIWKNRIVNELVPADYLKLPSTLRDINVTGGEPFLRKDLPLIIKNIKIACPKSRLVVNTNGFLPKIIEQQIDHILQYDPKIAIRLSLDGLETTHDQIRRVPNGYKTVIQSLRILQKHHVKDLGISFTIMENNYREINQIFNFCQKEKIQFSPTLVSDSPIYFGNHTASLYPKNHQKLELATHHLLSSRLKSLHPKDWFRAWFEKELITYHQTRHRPLPCSAGKDFFYMDSVGNIYACHIKNQLLGNLKKTSFFNIWSSSRARSIATCSSDCNNCWMICTAKTSINHHFIPIFTQIIYLKFLH